MLIFLRHQLAFLATPKTGTTAIEMALRSQAEIIFAKNRKHVTAARYVNKVAPFLEDTFGVRPASVAVMREPVEQLRSWYKYRSQSRLDGTDVSTAAMSFDDYVLEVISDDPPERARIGRQFNFLTDKKGTLQVDHLFAHAHMDAFIAFMSDRLGQPIEIEPRNISPHRDAPLSAEVEARLRHARAEDFALYDRLLAAKGHLTAPA